MDHRLLADQLKVFNGGGAHKVNLDTHTHTHTQTHTEKCMCDLLPLSKNFIYGPITLHTYMYCLNNLKQRIFTSFPRRLSNYNTTRWSNHFYDIEIDLT